MDEQPKLDDYKKTSQKQSKETAVLSTETQEQQKASFVPDQDERFLGPVTKTGYVLQNNYRSYTTTQLKNALDQGDYKVVGRTFRGSRTRKSKKKEDNNHSEYMTPLVEAIDRLEARLNKPITPGNVEKQLEVLLDIYDSIFKHAFHYCEKQHPWFPEGKARRDMVLLIRDQANEERLRLANNARVLADKVRSNPEQEFTFADAIGMIRTQTIKPGENGITKIESGGKGTSDIIVAVKDDGSKLYIRPSESLKMDNVPCSVFLRETISHTEEEIKVTKETLQKKGLTEEEKEKEEQNLTNLEKDLEIQNMFERTLTGLSEKDEKDAEFALRKLSFSKPSTLAETMTLIRQNTMLFEKQGELRSYLEKAVKEPAYKEYVKKCSTTKNHVALDREFNAQDTMISRLLRAVKLTGKHLNQRNFARKVAMVKEGSNISNRNVAVSILARALGLRDIVAESQMVEVAVNGKKIHGTLMEEAKGEDLRIVYNRNRSEGRKTRYSANALKQLSNLQVFDILCGQVDRKTDNYMSVIERQKDGTDIVKEIKAIDNDMSCGMIDYEQDVVNHYDKKNKQTVKGYRQQLPAISEDTGLLSVQAIDKNLKNKIMAMSPSFIDFLLAGVLSAEERVAMKKRLIALKILFRNEDIYSARTGEPSVFLKTDKDWADFKARYEKDGTSDNTYILDHLRQ